MRVEILGAAAILALGLVAHAYLSTPRHIMTRMDDNTIMKLDRWTGTTSMCAQWTNENEEESLYCERLPELPPSDGETAV